MRLKVVYLIAAIIGVCVLLLVSTVSWLYNRMASYERSPACRLIDSPVSLAMGTIRTPEFKVNETAYYAIDLEVDANRDVEKMQCVMGLLEMDRWNRESQQRYANQCRGLPDLIDISWELMENGRVVEAAPTVPYRGDSHDHPYVLGGLGSVKRQIGELRLMKGHSYSLVLTVKRDASQLNPANPKIRVMVPAGVRGCIGSEAT